MTSIALPDEFKVALIDAYDIESDRESEDPVDARVFRRLRVAWPTLTLRETREALRLTLEVE